MTQKNCSIKTVRSTDTRLNRGIIDLRQEHLSSNSKRIHIVFGDACMSWLSSYLSIGITAIVIKMLDEGASVGLFYSLKDPVKALSKLDTDFCWNSKIELLANDGGQVLSATPIQIQFHYLRAAERYLEHNKCEPWMKDVVGKWRWVLESLANEGPMSLSKSLDVFIKMKLFSICIHSKSGLTLTEFSKWAAVVGRVRSCVVGPIHRNSYHFLKEKMPAMRFDFLKEIIERNRLNWSHLPKAVMLYDQLCLLDFAFHQIDHDGLFFRMVKNKRAEPWPVSEFSELSLQQAMFNPPEGTRAFVRGQAIREVSRETGAVANWMQVRTKTRYKNLTDPLITSSHWLPNTPRK